MGIRAEFDDSFQGVPSGPSAVEPNVPPPASAPDRIRTCDLRFRRPTLYPAELRARVWAWTQNRGFYGLWGGCAAPAGLGVGGAAAGRGERAVHAWR